MLEGSPPSRAGQERGEEELKVDREEEKRGREAEGGGDTAAMVRARSYPPSPLLPHPLPLPGLEPAKVGHSATHPIQ